MFKPTDPEMQVGDIDALYLHHFIPYHTFNNPTLQSFMTELREVLENIAQRQDIHNHVDGYGNFVVSVKVKKVS